MSFGSVGPRSGFKVGVVGGGSTQEDQSNEHDSSHKIYNPLEQNPQTVPLSDLVYSMTGHTPSGFSQQSFQGGMDPGTLIYYIAQEGFPGGLIIGQGSPKHENSEGGSSNEHIKALKGQERNINTPPDIEEAEEKGVKIRKIKESGKQHKLELLDGFPIHGALFDISGFRIPEVKDVPTALQHNTEMLRSSMLGQLNGQLSSLGGMLKGLMTGKMGGGGSGAGNSGFGGLGAGAGVGTIPLNQLSNIQGGLSFDSLTRVSPGTVLFANVVNPILGNVDANTLNANIELANAYIELNTVNPNANLDNVIYNVSQNAPQMVDSIKNLSILLPGLEVASSAAFVLGNAVHAPTYLQNAHDLLSQVTCMDDLMNVLKRLQFEEALFGQDKLDRLEIIRTTPWVDTANTRIGTVKQILYPNGMVSIQYSNTAIRVMNSFANATSNVIIGSSGYGSTPYTPSGSGGGGGGGGAGAVGQIAQQAQSIMGNMFGKSSGIMNDMMKRLHPGGEKSSKQLTEKLSNQDQITKKLMDIAKATLGGDPLSEQHYNKSGGGGVA